MIKKLAEQLVNLTIKQVNELTNILKNEYGIYPDNLISNVVNSNNENKVDDANEKSVFNIILKSSGNSKLSVVKLVKEITGKGLKESKDLVDTLPSTIKESLNKKEAEDLKDKFERVGAEIELK